MTTSGCTVCDDLWDTNNLIDCNGQRMCESCAKDLGYTECTVCGTWDECDVGMCYDCLGGW